jgi:tetratricopeptide (TPR) repeat protein
MRPWLGRAGIQGKALDRALEVFNAEDIDAVSDLLVVYEQGNLERMGFSVGTLSKIQKEIERGGSCGAKVVSGGSKAPTNSLFIGASVVVIIAVLALQFSASLVPHSDQDPASKLAPPAQGHGAVDSSQPHATNAQRAADRQNVAVAGQQKELVEEGGQEQAKSLVVTLELGEVLHRGRGLRPRHSRKAIDLYKEHLKVLKADSQQLALLDAIGDAYVEIKKYQKALKYHRRALRTRKRQLNHGGVSQNAANVTLADLILSHANVATDLQMTFQFDSAIKELLAVQALQGNLPPAVRQVLLRQQSGILDCKGTCSRA